MIKNRQGAFSVLDAEAGAELRPPMHYAKNANKPHEIVPLIGIPDSQEPYVNPEYPNVPTGAFVEYWNCGCSATPCGFGNTSLQWAQCAVHRDIDIA